MNESWWRAVPDSELNALWALLFLSIDNPGVSQDLLGRAVDLYHGAELEMRRRYDGRSESSPDEVPDPR